jgi:ribosomal protein S18 acetylase RimI-like enzyme
VTTVTLGLSETALRAEDAEAVAAMLNEAYEELRRLPRLDIYLRAAPPLATAEALRQAMEAGALRPEASRVLWKGARPVATVGVGIECGASAKLQWLAVAPDHRRRGLARHLLNRVIAAAKSAGCATVAIGPVDSRWQAAVRFLENHGFAWTDPDHCNITMQMDIATWQPTDPVLPPGFTIRHMREEDEEGWTLVKRRAFGDDTPMGWWRQVWGSQPDHDPDGWKVCEYGGRIVGIAAAVVKNLPEGGRGCCIEWVGVLPEFQGMGLGRALMTACLNHAARFRPNPMVVVTQRFRTAAVALYESLGFRIANEYRRYVLELGGSADPIQR